MLFVWTQATDKFKTQTTFPLGWGKKYLGGMTETEIIYPLTWVLGAKMYDASYISYILLIYLFYMLFSY